jgi:hypothetical protein
MFITSCLIAIQSVLSSSSESSAGASKTSSSGGGGGVVDVTRSKIQHSLEGAVLDEEQQGGEVDAAGSIGLEKAMSIKLKV